MYALQLITLAAAALAIPMPGNEGYGNDKAMKSYGSDSGYGSGSGSSDSGYGSGGRGDEDRGDEHNDYARGEGRGDGRGVWRPENTNGRTFAEQCGNNANAHCCESRGRGSSCKKIIALDLLVQDHCKAEVCCSGPQHGLVNVGCLPGTHVLAQ
ncbi:hypothetical protein CDD80_3420 [Ophiocordyceps camponoti-rufipedis]|uniref:Hydrophobin n=1 Tax=Ophiocordyceps camponoti-rufipedis TaxID=2004952 RepID=A0A2C5XIV1_9HYPO|nr:hypothetical protein CDD80_3420 [Ophiocordyceps camponoti-rufipedis]